MFMNSLKKILIKRALIGPTQIKVKNQLIQKSKRGFSSTNVKMQQTLAFGVGGTCIAGLTYLSYIGNKQWLSATPEQRLHLFNPIVQHRIRQTFGYFTGACVTTGGFCLALRNSKLVHMNPYMLFGLSTASLIGTIFCDYEKNWELKNIFYGAFVGTISLSIIPLINMCSMPIIYDALIATGVTMGSLGIVAFNSPSEQFLKWGGPLSLGLGGLLGISLLGILYPGSKVLRNIWLYGGLALFSAYILFDTQKIIHNAKTQKNFDPINESLDIYLDAINLFIRFLIIFSENENEKKK